MDEEKRGESLHIWREATTSIVVELVYGTRVGKSDGKGSSFPDSLYGFWLELDVHLDDPSAVWAREPDSICPRLPSSSNNNNNDDDDQSDCGWLLLLLLLYLCVLDVMGNDHIEFHPCARSNVLLLGCTVYRCYFGHQVSRVVFKLKRGRMKVLTLAT